MGSSPLAACWPHPTRASYTTGVIDSFQGCWQRPGQLRGHEAGPGGDPEAPEFAKSNTAKRANWSQKGREGRDGQGVTSRQKGLAAIGHQSHRHLEASGPAVGGWTFPTFCPHTRWMSAVQLLLQGPRGRPVGRDLDGLACSLPPGAGLKASDELEGGTLAEGGPSALPDLLRRGVWAAPRTE